MPGILGSMKFTSTICAQAAWILSCPLFCRKRSHMVSWMGVGASCTRWGSWSAVFRECSLRVLAVFRGSPDFWVLPVLKFFGGRYCGYCLYSGSCTAYTPSARSIWACSTASTNTPSTRNTYPTSIPILSVLGMRSVLDTPEYSHRSMMCTGSISVGLRVGCTSRLGGSRARGSGERRVKSAEEVDWGRDYTARHHMSMKGGGPAISASQPEVIDATEDAGIGATSCWSVAAGGTGLSSGSTDRSGSLPGTMEPATPPVTRGTANSWTVAKSSPQAWMSSC